MSSDIQAFGKYLLLERLNAGGMAEIFLAKSQGASGITKFVAMKRILPQLSKDSNYIDMFKTEAKVVMNLNHSNVVQIYEFGVENEQFYLVMEYVEGQNLRQALHQLKKNNKQFSIDQIVYLIKEAASGLDHAHRCIDSTTGKLLNIIHRDISPQNIMISFEGEIKIVDFGIAKSESQMEQTRVGTLKGKYAYMSPEQAEGQECDARTDIFSLGIVLWELLAHERLFTAENESAILRKIKECAIPSLRNINPAIPADLERIVLTALAKERGRRYESSEALARDLNRFLNTNYPEFSKQEFSKFMKSLNKETYLENRKKLAEYAKIQNPCDVSALSINAAGAKAKSAAQANDIEAPVNLDLNIENSRIDLKDLNNAQIAGGRRTALSNVSAINQTRSHVSQSQPSITSSVTKSGLPGINPHMSGNTVTGIKSPLLKPNPNKSPQYKNIQKKESSFSLLFIFALIIGTAGWWYWGQLKKNSSFNNVDGSTSLASKNSGQLPRVNSVQPTPQQSQQQISSVTIESTPTGAAVFINDAAVGTTPFMTSLPMNASFRIKIIKEGYIPTESNAETPTGPTYSKNFVLVQEPITAAVTINKDDSNPSSSSWSVYINNQLVSRNLPFQTKISAGIATSIKVVDPKSKKEGEETVILNKGQTKTITIKPNKPTTVLN